MIKKFALVAVMLLLLCGGVYASELQGVKMSANGKLDVYPKFKGKDVGAFSRWMSTRVYSGLAERGVYGYLRPQFVIGKDGKVRNIRVLESPHPKYTKNVTRLIEKSSKHWTPGYSNGRAVDVRYVVPIYYGID